MTTTQTPPNPSEAADVEESAAVNENEAPAKPPAAIETVPFRTKLKHGLLKVIDVTALGFLEPVVRLCYGEEPNVQIKKIGKFIGVPILAFIIFLLLWGWLAPMHKTKSGEVPTPDKVWDAGMGSLQMYEWEMAKKHGYTLTGDVRSAEFERAIERKAEVEQLLAEAREDLDEAREARSEEIGEELSALDTAYNELRSAQRSYRKDGLAELNAHAETLTAGDQAAIDDLLVRIAAYQAADKEARTLWQDARDIRDELKNEQDDDIERLTGLITDLADEQLFINALVDSLGEGSREVRVAELETKIAGLEAVMLTAQGKDLVKAGIDLIAARDSLDQAIISTKAEAYTLPYQVVRSIACVFIGFLAGSLIAIPLGVMCGLSSTFMAAMTPFIALFKPVSPIIWLLIALIIVGGFIPDPDDHWLIAMFDGMWLTSWIEVNPGFIASAVTVAMCSLWATLVNTALGVASVDKDHMNVARVLKLKFHQRLFKIILPSALPLVFAGMRISLGVGWMVLIAAELLANSQGVGVFVWDAYNSGSSDSFPMMFVAVFVVGFIGLILDRIMIIFQRLASFEGGVATV